jgi:cysteine desulfurase
MYLDHNATSPMGADVQRAVSTAMTTAWANPSSPHRQGQMASVMVEKSRRIIAERMNVHPKTVFFTSGATEGNAWVLSGSPSPVVSSAVEHPSVLAWADETIPVDANGVIDLDCLDARLSQGEALVSVMAANNETGVLQPIAAIAAVCRKHGARFHCDATQCFGRVNGPVDADFVTVSAHKLGGPRGVGAMIGTAPPKPLLLGGKQERGQRAGTLNVPGIVGFGVAVETEADWSGDEREKLEAFCVSRGGRVVGGGADRLPNTLSVLFGIPGDVLVPILDLAGVSASTGSACASGASQGSHVLAAMGIEGIPIRFSFGPGARARPAIDALGRALDQVDGACV